MRPLNMKETTPFGYQSVHVDATKKDGRKVVCLHIACCDEYHSQSEACGIDLSPVRVRRLRDWLTRWLKEQAK